MTPRELTYDYVPIATLTHADRDALWEVYRRHFNADRSEMDASLGRATHVTRFRVRKTGELRGMVAISLKETEIDGRRFFWLWAGALAIDRDCRGKWLLERFGLEFIAKFRLRHPFASLIWMYTSISFQSFRMASRSFDEYWPHPDRETPPWEAKVIDQLTAAEFGDRWDPQAKVLRGDGKKHIRPDSSVTSANDRYREFYARINPNAAHGDAVVMMAPLNLKNVLALTKRMTASMREGTRVRQPA